MTAIVVGDLGDDAEVVGDEHDRHPAFALQALEQREDLRLDGHVERRRRLVGDQQLGLVGERHRDHHALAHAAGELVRVGVHAPGRIGDADELEQLDRARSRALALDTSWCARIASSDLRCRRGRSGCSEDSGSWKTIAISLPRIARSSLLGQREQVAALEEDAPGHARALRARETQHAERSDCLTRARLADDPERLPARSCEGDPVDGVHDAVFGGNATRRSSTRSSGCSGTRS